MRKVICALQKKHADNDFKYFQGDTLQLRSDTGCKFVRNMGKFMYL